MKKYIIFTLMTLLLLPYSINADEKEKNTSVFFGCPEQNIINKFGKPYHTAIYGKYKAFMYKVELQPDYKILRIFEINNKKYVQYKTMRPVNSDYYEHYIKGILLRDNIEFVDTKYYKLYNIEDNILKVYMIESKKYKYTIFYNTHKDFMVETKTPLTVEYRTFFMNMQIEAIFYKINKNLK